MSVFKESQENDEERKRKETEERIRTRIECEKRAFNIVQELIEPDISPQYLLQVGNLIGPSHYVDIVEERSISQICGYPLCNNSVKTVLKQKYHISTKSNKIYDISERKKFCSNKCFKASKYFENQIPSAPVWARRFETKVDFELLTETRGSIGEEVIVSTKDALKEEVERLKKLDREGKDTDNNDQGIGQANTTTFDSHLEEFESQELESNVEDLESRISQLSTDTSPVPSEIAKSPQEQCELQNPKQTVPNQSSESKSEYMLRLLDKRKKHLSKMSVDVPLSASSNPQTKNPGVNVLPKTNTEPQRRTSPLRLLSDVIKQWVTENTKMYLKQQSLSIVCASMEEHYDLLCQRLEEKEREKEKLELLLSKKLQIEEDKSKMKPLPDYGDLKEEVRKEEIKVREFYRGNFCTEKDLQESEKDYMEEDKAPVIMPTVDSHDQMIIRRRIILERLMKVLPEVLSPLKLTISDVTEEIRELVHTFRFSSSNIIFKPAQWTMVAMIILKLLSNRDKRVEESFTNPSAVKYLDIILKALGENIDTFQTVIDSILK